MRGGETPWPGGDLNTRLGEVWGSENKGGQRDVSDGETARRRGGPPSRCGSGETAGTRGGGCAPPQDAQRLDPSQCHPRGPRLSCHPRSSRASWGPAGRSCLCADPGGGGGPQASKVRPRRGRPRARGAPPPPVWLPPASQRGALFVSARGPGPRGRPGARGRAGEGGALPTCLCEAEPGAPWVL